MAAENQYDISIRNVDGSLFRYYKANVVPHSGDFLYFPHFGTYKIISVIFHISDDAPNRNDLESVMFIDVIVDLSNTANWEKDVLKGHS